MAVNRDVIFRQRQSWSPYSTQARQMRARGDSQAQVLLSKHWLLNSRMQKFQLMLLWVLDGKIRAPLQGAALNNNSAGL